MSRLSDLIDQVDSLSPELAQELRAEVGEYAKRRPFGLNFERHTPESVRLWNRPVRLGDYVNVLPPRGQAETMENHVLWRVVEVSVDGATARLIPAVESKNEQAQRMMAPVEDLVVVARFKEPIYPGLRETGRVERGGDKPYQVVINGENFHTLESLLYPYEGKVDCIYIDPPYNTGDKSWKYNNDYVDDNDQYRHSKWLAMMERRLKLAKRLLNPEDSVLICTIDEKEYARCELLIEQIFTGCPVQTVVITINKNGVARGNQFKRAEEYAIYVFVGSATPCPVDVSSYSVELAEKSEKVAAGDGSSRSQRVRWEWLLRGGPNAARTARPNLFYPIYIDEGQRKIVRLGKSLPLNVDWHDVAPVDGLRAIWPIRTDGREATWRISQPALLAKLSRGCARVGEYDSKADRYSILYLGDLQEERLAKGELRVTGLRDDGSVIVESVGEPTAVPTTVWTGPRFSAGEYGSRYIKRFLGERKFSFPKSLYAVELSLSTVVSDKPDALVLDFFAGSGTTAHAVMRLNHQDGGRRRCICVTNNEVSDDEAKRFTKKGLRQGDPEWEARGICEYVTKPRIKAAITGLTPEGEPIKGDYKFTDEFPMADGFEENAVFFDLTYQDELMVGLDQAFGEIAPLLWMRAGSEGRIIKERKRDFDVSEHYAVLFDYAYASRFLEAIAGNDKLRVVYIVTDQDSRFQDVAWALPDGIEPVRLYESYLRSFRISHGED